MASEGGDHKARILRALGRWEARQQPKKKTKGKRLDVPYERQEAAWFVQWLDARGLLFCHIPNEGKRSNGAALQAVGLRRGAPDLLVFTCRPGIRGIAIELKRRKYYRHAPEQVEFLARLRALGWVAEFAHGCEEAIAIVEANLGE